VLPLLALIRWCSRPIPGICKR